MFEFKAEEIKEIYADFNSPIAALDCGKKCSPHNEYGIPFCCDIRHAVPTAYDAEWEYLQPNTKLWFPWTPDDQKEKAELEAETPPGMRLLACRGVQHCEREYRTLTCRQFPFFPYVDSQGEFLGLSYYWEYEEVCWVISNLQAVTREYLDEFVQAFKLIFERMPQELETYQYHAERMRDHYNEQRRAIPLLHRNGFAYKITTHNERMRRMPVEQMPKHGVYKITDLMIFPDEIE